MVLAALALVAALAAAWGAVRVGRVLAAGSGYKAKVLCAAVFVAGRDLDPQDSEEISAEAYRILRLFRGRVDRERGEVTVSCLGLKGARAVYVPGRGTTLLYGGEPPPRPAQARADAPAPPRGAPAPDASAPWPRGDAPAAAPELKLAGILQRAFLEVNPSKPRRTRALLVVRGGFLLAERYAPGIAPAMPLPGWSMSKSVLGALVGVAVGQGKLRIDERRLLPEWSSAGDPRGEILLEDLLRMRGGLRWAEVYANPLSDVVQMLFAKPDAGAFAASKRLRVPPGREFQYSSGTTNIVSRVLRRAVGEEAYAAFPRRELFEPLGMRTAVFERDAAGTFVGSSFLHASARDWARFGQLYLQDGVWEGRRVLPEGWVRFSTTPTPQSPDGRFGAHWWLRCPPELGGDSPAGRRLPADAFYALGHEGQCLTVVPSRELVVVRLGLSIRLDAWDHAAFLDELLTALP